MRTIYLVRHADYEGNGHIIPGRLPVPLSPKGIIEAQKLQEYFIDKNIETIYSSPVQRAYQTAEIIASASTPIITDLRLAETFSAYQGQHYKEEVDWRDLYRHIETLGGEDLEDQKERMVDFWEHVAVRSEGNIVIVSHGHPLYILYAHLAHKPLETDIEEMGHVSDKENYQKEGTIRPIVVDNGKMLLKDIIIF